MSINSLVSQLKENGEDYEFYPTTDKMLMVVQQHSIENRTILDIGCGNAKLKEYFPHSDYFVIEKSKILINNLPSDVFVLGTDFDNCTLIDKKVDMIFCNPPYSEFEKWTIRIIKEGNFKEAFLIIPQRWKNDEEIKQALSQSNTLFRVVDSTDFLDAERQARAKVDIIKFTKNEFRDSWVDPYKNWFEETFNFKEKKDRTYDFTHANKKEKEIKNQLINANNKIESLVNLYNDEMNRLFSSFKAICELDEETLHDIGVETRKVIESLKYKIEHTKILYWRLIFDYLDEITKRLTAESRKKLFERFNRLNQVDFNESNIQAVVIWVLKNASILFDEQLVDLYKEFTTPDNIIKYKSNQRVFKRNEYWNSKFEDKKTVSHYCLSYRMVVDSLYFQSSCSWKEEIDKGKAQTIVDDLSVIANNLGFEVASKDIATTFGEKYYIMGKNKPLIEFKVYKNGNTHIKLDIEFCKAMNVEVSRLLGWIQNKQDIENEFPEEYKGASKYYGANFRYSLDKPNVKLLTTTK